jgi:GTP:adenosylcobinamide-phosphate guanylyltransferase
VASVNATRRTTAPYTALVLAGSRTARDRFAESQGHTRKALVPVAGVPMLVRVVHALAGASDVEHIHVHGDDEAMKGLPELQALVAARRLTFGRCAESPSATVLQHLQETPPPGPLLVASGDHALLDVAMVDHFCTAARGVAGDVAVATVAARVVQARYPDCGRTWIRLQDGAYKGGNLFALFSPRAALAAGFLQRVEQFRKRPWRLVAALGFLTLARFGLGRLDLAGALAAVSRACGVRIASVEMPFPECALDVDRVEDLALATRILSSAETSPTDPPGLSKGSSVLRASPSPSGNRG